MGKPDDCRELTVLRKFRDTYLSSSDSGKALVTRYYEEAPGIVAAIESLPQAARDSFYGYAAEEIDDIVATIEDGQYQEAIDAYIQLFNNAKELALGAIENADKSE
jgi:hypothetical protein